MRRLYTILYVIFEVYSEYKYETFIYNFVCYI